MIVFNKGSMTLNDEAAIKFHILLRKNKTDLKHFKEMLKLSNFFRLGLYKGIH